MSVSVSSPVVQDLVKDKKERPPRLPAKFAKFIQFGFYFVNSYNQQVTTANDGRTPLDSDALFLALQVFGSVDDQKSFVQGFFDNNKDVNKQLRDVVKKFVKDSKPPATRKPRAKKADKPADAVPSDAVPSNAVPSNAVPSDAVPSNAVPSKSKRGRKPAVQANGNPDIVAEIVALAQNSDPIPPSLSDIADKKDADKAKKDAEKAKKDAEKAEAKAKKDAEKAEAKAKKDADKTKKVSKKVIKKEDTPPRVDTPVLPNDDDDNEEPLQVSILSLNGTQYLIDDQQTVYDFTSQEPIGTFNPQTQTIALD